MKVRYLDEYIQLSKAVFGRSESDAMNCFAGEFVSDVSGNDIRAAKSKVQEAFVRKHGQVSLLGKIERAPFGTNVVLVNLGDPPDFLPLP